MTSARGIVGIIGIRAEIIGVRQYLADGREIERINDHLAASTLKIQASNNALGRSQQVVSDALKKAVADRQLFNKAVEDTFKAEQKLKLAQTTNVAGQRGSGGRFLPAQPVQANIDQAAKELAFQQSLTTFIAKGSTQSAKELVVARKAEGVQLASNNRLMEQRNALEAQLASTQRSRIKAAATTAAIAGTAIIGATAAGAISQAAKYEQALSKINVLTNATDEETAQLGERFKTLSTQIPVSATDLALASYQALSSGINDVNQAYKLTEQAAKAAVAGQADIKTIVSAVTTVLNAYPKGLIDANQVTDILFATVRAGKGEFNDLANSIGRVLPSAVALGVKFTEVGAAMAAMTNAGLNAEEAATALRAILQDLATNDDSTKTAEALKTIGITSEELRKSIKEKGLAPALVELFKLFGDNLTALEPIIPNIRALTGAFIAFGKSGENLAAIQATVNRSVGIVDQSFEKTRNNAANLAKLFSNQVNVALIEIGTAILPSVTRALQDLIGWLQNNRKEIQSFVSQGLQGIIDIGREAAKGIKLISDVLGELLGVMSSIVGQSNATKLALAAIGTGLAFALPGGPLIVGLTTILILLGQIQDLAGGGKSSPVGRAIVQGAATAAGAIGGGLLGAATFTPFGVGAGAIGGGALGAAGGGVLADLIFGKDKGKSNAAGTAAEQIEKANKAFGELSNQALKDIPANIAGINQKAKEAAETLKKLAQEFEKTSEAAGQVASITEEFKKFGTISKQLADAAGLSAAQSGQVQAVDAIIRAREREQAEIFNNIQAINAIAGAYQRSAQVGRELLLQLAQASLEASQTALSNVFSRPTREVADLGVPLARQQLTTAQRELRNTPAINALNQQLRNIDRQIAAQNRANQIANRNAARQREQQQKAQQAAQKAAQKAQEDQANALKLANLIAQINAERQLAALQKLIDATTKQQSNLQETFKKNNEELRKKFFEATSRGDEAGALSILDEQQKLTKAYHAQNDALTKQGQQQTTALKQAQEAEQERQRQAQLAEALAQSQQRQIESTDDFTDSLDSAKEAQDAQTQAMEDSKQAIQDQIDAFQGPIDQSKEQEAAIQRQIAVYEAQTNILKAQGVAANKTLFTQEQQRQAAEHFIGQIEYASGQAKALADNFYAFIPGAKDADLAFKTLKGAVNAINDRIDPTLLKNFDAVNARLDLLKLATGDITNTFNNSSTQTAQTTEQAIGRINQAASDWQTGQEAILVDTANAANNASITVDLAALRLSRSLDGVAPSIQKMVESVARQLSEAIKSAQRLGGVVGSRFAAGGIVTRPTLGIIGESGPEAVLPLNDVRRMSQIISQINGISGTVGVGGETTGAFAPIRGRSGFSGLTGSVGAGDGAAGMFAPISGRSGFSRNASNIYVNMPPSITTALLTRRQTPSVFAPTITVTGETLDTMEATAIRAVQDAFQQARTMSGRQGGLITTGLGPSH